jgi:hypothetical protein
MESGREEDKAAAASAAGHQPYSPSDPAGTATSDSSESDSEMDWQSNLDGIQQMLHQQEGQPMPPGGKIVILVTPPNEDGPQAGGTTPQMVPPPDPLLNTQPDIQSNTQEAAIPPVGADATPRAVSVPNIEDPLARSKAFIQARMEKKCNEIIDAFGEDGLAYNTIRTQNKTKLTVTDLKSAEKQVLTSPGAMVDLLDGRLRLANIEVILGQKQAWTYSMDLKTMECVGCSKHFNQLPFPRRGSQVRGSRQAVWLTDQAMPPILPSSSQQDCIKIFRMDCGMLPELTDGLIRILAGRHITAGSVILITSATHMQAVGTAAYTEDLLEAIKTLRRNLGDHLIYGPLPNFMINGCDDPYTIQTVIEIGQWAHLAFKHQAALLRNSFGLVEEQLKARGACGVQTVQRCTLRLPLAAPGQDGKKHIVVTTGGTPDIPVKLKAASAADEKEAVECLATEIREKMAIDLDTKPIINRWPDVSAARLGAANVKNFFLVGSSHAGKLGAALRKMGHNAEVVYESNWRVYRDNAVEMAEKIGDKMNRVQNDAVIFCMLDNNIYCSLDSDGNTTSATRDHNGKMHMKGDLIVVSKSAQHILFSAVRPMLDAARGRNCIIMAPMPRYLFKGCCEDSEHLTNRNNSNFRQHLTRDLKEVAENIRDFCFTTGYRMVRILDPAVSWRGKEDDTIWKDDPVHPSEAAYSMLAEGVISIHRNMESGAKKRPRTNSETGEPGPSSALNRLVGGGRGGHRERGRGGGGHGAGGAGGGRGGRIQTKRGSYRSR